MADVKQHNTKDSCWIVVEKRVYDITKFIASHPGGKRALLKNAGTNATAAFQKIHGESESAKLKLSDHFIGLLIEPDDLNAHHSIPEKESSYLTATKPLMESNTDVKFDSVPQADAIYVRFIRISN